MSEADKILIYWGPLLAGAGFLLTVVIFFLKRTLSKSEENLEKLSETISKKIDNMANKTDERLDKFAEDQEKLKKEFYDFKADVASNYTKQEDFSSQTRDLNIKLDSISAGMNKIIGQLDKGVK